MRFPALSFESEMDDSVYIAAKPIIFDFLRRCHEMVEALASPVDAIIWYIAKDGSIRGKWGDEGIVVDPITALDHYENIVPHSGVTDRRAAVAELELSYEAAMILAACIDNDVQSPFFFHDIRNRVITCLNLQFWELRPILDWN